MQQGVGEGVAVILEDNLQPTAFFGEKDKRMYVDGKTWVMVQNLFALVPRDTSMK